MKISTALLLVCCGIVAFAVLSDGKGGWRLPGPSASGPGAVGPAASSGWPASARSSAGSSPGALGVPSTAAPPTPGVFSTLFAFIDRGIAMGNHSARRQQSDLRIARGTVVDRLVSGAVLDCSSWVVIGSAGVYAGDGLGMNPIQANLVDAHELLQFGRLLTVDNGVVRQSPYARGLWVPESYLAGLVLVTGYPAAALGPVRGLKVVVAPDGTGSWRGQSIPAYTASFTLATESR